MSHARYKFRAVSYICKQPCCRFFVLLYSLLSGHAYLICAECLDRQAIVNTLNAADASYKQESSHDAEFRMADTQSWVRDGLNMFDAITCTIPRVLHTQYVQLPRRRLRHLKQVCMPSIPALHDGQDALTLALFSSQPAPPSTPPILLYTHTTVCIYSCRP